MAQSTKDLEFIIASLENRDPKYPLHFLAGLIDLHLDRLAKSNQVDIQASEDLNLFKALKNHCGDTDPRTKKYQEILESLAIIPSRNEESGDGSSSPSSPTAAHSP